jgi:chemotaxis protein CheD
MTMAGLSTGSGQMVRRVVGIAELFVSTDPNDLIVTYALGSCLGICIHDPVAGVGGLLHVMLPSGSVDTEKAKTNPARFVDTGVPFLFKEAYKLGAKKERIIAKVAGGAAIANNGGGDSFQIGKRNFIALKKLMWKNGVLLKGQDVGKNHSRTVSLDVRTGEVRVKAQGKEMVL